MSDVKIVLDREACLSQEQRHGRTAAHHERLAAQARREQERWARRRSRVEAGEEIILTLQEGPA